MTTALAALATLGAAAVEVNQASLAQLETVKGIGPDLSEAILAERARAPFVDWSDLMRRVRGVGPASAARLSSAGLTVSGQSLNAAGSARGQASRPQ